ncbi:MAG: hypothetical protein HFJ06_10040 [Lachnospiraceae bacterium]|nr:hypothetical protein [Lachnospiraceae bacterium]
MSVFSVEPIKLSKEAENLQSITSVLNGNKESLEKIRQSLILSGSAGNSVKNSLKLTSEEMENIIKSIKSAKKVLSEISSNYINTEKIISNQNIEQGNPAFDDEGSYGGNQSNPVTKSEELADIVRKYYPDFTDKEVEDYLKKLESEGCGYVAMSNTIFAQFVGKEKEFEKTFGFPMYDKNGDLNYDAMVTDFYAATDNHNEKGWIFKRDVIDESEDKSATEGWGTTRETREYRWEKYMEDHGIDADVKNVKVTPENYDEVASKGDIVVGVQPCILYDESGNKAVDIDGGHAMTVTGKTDDGMYRVSSWGEEYYIKPGDSVYDRMQFQQIIY